jgi:hypothetical protein
MRRAVSSRDGGDESFRLGEKQPKEKQNKKKKRKQKEKEKVTEPTDHLGLD